MLKILILSIIAGVLYRMGGTKLGTKWRDIGVPIAVCCGLTFNWGLVVSAFLFFATLTTYWKRKGTEAKFINWYITFLFYIVAFAPYALVQKDFQDFGWCLATCPVLCAFFSRFIVTDYVEEFGRGFITAFLILLFLH